MRDDSHALNDSGVPGLGAGQGETTFPGDPAGGPRASQGMALPEGFEPSYQP